MTLAEWIAAAVRDAPQAGPADIERALVALESRLARSEARLDQLIRPLDAEVTRLTEETTRVVRLRNPPPQEAPERAPEPATLPAAGEPAEPVLERLRGRRWGRRAAVLGAIALVAGGAAAWAWLWSTQDDISPPALASLPGLLRPAPDQTPPPGLPGMAAPELPEIGPGPVPTAQPQPATGYALIPPELPRTPAETAALRARAERREVAAEYVLGLALLEGHGTDANPREAREWLATAAIAGHPLAQYRVGQLYADGIGFPRDRAQAFFWIQSSAEQGVTEAAFALGRIYAEGAGVPPSHALAARWYGEAARQNHAGALFALGEIYERGLDVRADTGRAFDYYRRAAAAGSAEAAARVTALMAGEGPAEPMTDGANGRSSGPAAIPDATLNSAPALARAELAEMQALLRALAFDPGATDGTLTARTGVAIRQFQEIAGLPADGRPSRALLEQLREVAGATRSGR